MLGALQDAESSLSRFAQQRRTVAALAEIKRSADQSAMLMRQRYERGVISLGDSLDTEKKESIKTLLLALWKKDDQSFARAEYVALSNALQLYYQKLDKEPSLFPCFDTFYDFLKDEFVIVLEGDFGN